MALDEILERIQKSFENEVIEYYKQLGITPDPSEKIVSRVYFSQDTPDNRGVLIETDITSLIFEGPLLSSFSKKLRADENKRYFLKPSREKLKSKEEVINEIKKTLNEEGISEEYVDYDSLSFEEQYGSLEFRSIKPSVVIGLNGKIVKKMADRTGWVIAVLQKEQPDVKKIFSSSQPGKEIKQPAEDGPAHSPIESILDFERGIKFFESTRDFLSVRGLGGCNEVGRSAVYLEFQKGNNVLLDFGVSFSRNFDRQFPLYELVDFEKLNVVLLSHVHSDHLNGIPLLYRNGFKGQVVTHKYNEKVIPLILQDYMEMYKNIHGKLPYSYTDIISMANNMVYVDFDDTKELSPGVKATFLNAGHILGSAMIKIQYGDDNSILYTGDFSTRDNNLISGAALPSGITHIISESTYGNKINDKSYEAEKDEFIQSVKRTIDRNGSVIIPCFAVGRSQEVLYTLIKSDIKAPIFIDGLIRDVNPIAESILKNSQDRYVLAPKDISFNNPRINNIDKVRSETIRKEIETDPTPKIILTTSGMGEGLAERYIKSHLENERNQIAFVGYQVNNSLGRQLVDNKPEIIFSDGEKKQVKATITQNHFSAHADGLELRQLVRINPETILLMHGEPSASKSLKEGLLHDYASFNKDAPFIRCPYLGEAVLLRD